MAIDKVTLQVLANHCRAAAENMAYTLYRTAHFHLRQGDGGLHGDAHRPYRARPSPCRWISAPPGIPGINYGRAIAMIEDYEPGDIGFTNDPYSGYLATHAPDTASVEAGLPRRRASSASSAAISTTPIWAARCRPACRAR